MRPIRALSLALLLLSGCSVFTPLPEPTTLETRLGHFPSQGLDLERPVTIRWNGNQVPYILAQTDRDLAYTLGLVHGHLRLGQIALIKRIAQGRLAEMAGPIAAEIDAGLRTLNFGRAAPEMEAALPEETRVWVSAFVAGLNRAQQHAVDNDLLPLEFRVLAMEPEPWTVSDILTIGRFVSIDINWGRFVTLLPFRQREDWPSLWQAFLDTGDAAIPSYDPNADDGVRFLTDLLVGFSRSGSNSFVVHGSRTGTGGALIANDPHLGIFAPNTWLLAGVKSPSYHAVGMMPPGLPLIGLGRNADIAWGGTNMQSANSDLVNVTDLPPEAFTSREEAIKVRWWFDDTVRVRETPFGPVVSDLDLVEANEDLSLRWIGHRPSDELTAWLRASRATDWDSFKAALADYAVTPLNIVYADRRGHIGLLTGTTLPRRPLGRPEDLVQSPAGPNDWTRLATPRDLPAVFDPPAGFIASANNPPAPAEVPIGYFFAPSDRIDRLNAVLSDRAQDPVTVEDLSRLQTDTYNRRSHDLVVLMLQKLASAQESGWTPPAAAARVVPLLAQWDGRYEEDSREALAAETFLVALFETFFDDDQREIITALGRPRETARPILAEASPTALGVALAAGIEAADAAIDDFGTWGGIHRLRLGHPLSRVPLVGGRFVFLDVPAGGSNETVMKTAHQQTLEAHPTRYGSNARHVSDLSDPDANYFVLLGGQDGVINSDTALDQVELWRERRFIRMPLTEALIEAEFTREMGLAPRS